MNSGHQQLHFQPDLILHTNDLILHTNSIEFGSLNERGRGAYTSENICVINKFYKHLYQFHSRKIHSFC